MSYRAFKRLLGETSLERKCRFLFGAAILVLITLSFWLYAYQTELLAYDQAVTSCRLLVSPSLGHRHLRKKEDSELVRAAFQMVEPGKEKEYQYQYDIIVEKANANLDTFERDLFRVFRKDPESENVHNRFSEQVLVYSKPIWAGTACRTSCAR